MKATTLSDVSAVPASFFLASCMAKAKERFTAGELMILPAAKDICHEQVCRSKGGTCSSFAITITRWTDDISEGFEAQFVKRFKESLWYVMQVDESINTSN